MGEIGSWFARTFPEGLVISVGSPGPGRQWFAEAKMHDQSVQQRVDLAMPQFVESVQHWQQESGVQPNATALIGFSQGGSMVLEAVKAHADLAGRAVIFNGRFITLPEKASTRTTVHLIHGEYDEYIPVHYAEEGRSV